MAKTQRRRRKEGKTNYKSRFTLLKSKLPRLVVRKSNRYILAQLVSSNLAQDSVLESTTSKSLLDHGWPKDKLGSLKNIQATYLTGYMLGKRLGKDKEAILDKGLHRNVAGSRVYAVLLGAIEAGMVIPHDPKAFPSKEKMSLNKVFSQLIIKIKENLNG